MTMRKCFIKTREFIPEVAEITGLNPITIEYEFDKAQILETDCVFEVDLTVEQAAEIDRRARVRAEQERRERG